ncbi:uncharacterized protein LOC141591604 isoform X1 [Silene latifolia]|uniref:uncharacterized protein LOC141591604 isoform X1 n=1 Tax=Silene latifolia TaxID=37657 RepID=UPI003D77E408
MVVCSMYRMHIKAKKASWKLKSLYPLKVSKGLPVVQFSDEEIQFPHAWSQVMEAGLLEEGPQAALCTAKWQIMQGGSSDIGYTLTVSNARCITNVKATPITPVFSPMWRSIPKTSSTCKRLKICSDLGNKGDICLLVGVTLRL